jgi:hypothetical protein
LVEIISLGGFSGYTSLNEDFLHRIVIRSKLMALLDAHNFIPCHSMNATHIAWLCFHEEVKSEKMLDSRTAWHSSLII